MRGSRYPVPWGPGASECWSLAPSGVSPSPLAVSGTFSESFSASGGSAVSGVSSSGLAFFSSISGYYPLERLRRVGDRRQ
jgi:hypothetical protein